jgi:hypothetical protein
VAVPGKEVEILGIGTTPVQYSNGAFALNMLFRKGGWEVRKGFGQRAEYTTTFATRFFDESGSGGFSSKPQGFLTHLGSYLYHGQDFRQIISVFSGAFLSRNNARDSLTINGYLVEIYDVDRNVRWEEAIYSQTGQNDRATIDMPAQHGVYETSRDNSYEGFDHGRIEPFFFSEHEEMLFFGSPAAGVLFYKPTRFKERKLQQVEGTFRREASSQFSETSIIRRIDPMKGAAENQLAFEYLTANTLSGISDMASVGFSTVVAAGNAIYFSDTDTPFAFTTENLVALPTKYRITAIKEHLGNILIWTEAEMWHYTPSQGEVKSSGRLTKVSDLIGCLSPQSVAKTAEGVVWVDTNGIYITNNGLQHNVLSAPIKSFFNEFITNPVTSYYQRSGVADLTNTLPNSFYRFNPKMVNVAHSPSEDILLVSFPGEGIALVLTQGKWAVWTFESNVSVDTAGTPAPDVGTMENIKDAYIVADDAGLFMIGSVQSQSLTDAAAKWNTGTNQFDALRDDVEARSYYILEYNRGGSIDRSVDDEDYREPRAEYISTSWSLGSPNFILDKWLPVPIGFVFPGGTAVTSAQPTFLVPLNITHSVAQNLAAYDVSFTFDNTKWEPILRGTAEIDFILPAERQGSFNGYAQGAPTAANQVRLYSLPGGAVSTTGQEIRISWDTAIAGTSTLRLPGDRKNTLMYIPMRRKNTTTELSGMGLALGSIALAPATSILTVWEQQAMSDADLHKDDDVAQPVDWAYKSVQIGLDTPVRLKARGLFVQMLSHGPGTPADYLVPNWNVGVFNTLLAGDFRGWTSQIIDFAGVAAMGNSEQIDRIANKTTIRTRIINSANALVNKLFNQADVTYGNPASTSPGTYLIDDEEVNVMATSDATKGETLTYMVFGHLQNRAQKIHIDSIKALLREVGSRRRAGR